MATVSYSVETVVPEFISTYSATQNRLSAEHQPAVVALADGGFAVAYQWDSLEDSDDAVIVDFYNADGSRRFGDDYFSVDTEVPGAAVTSVSATQLSSGALLVTWTDSDDDGIHYATIDPSSGQILTEDTRLANTDGDDDYGKVVALAGGGWALVKADHTNSGSDRDADLLIYNSAGVLQGGTHALDDNSSRHEDFPAVAVLTAGRNKGAMAIAYEYEKADGSGTLGIAIEIWNAAGQRVLSPFPFDLEGDNNYDPAVVALKDGGFAVGYEDDEYGQSGYSVAFFDQDGNYQGTVRGDTGSAIDSDIAMTVLPNGLVYVTYTDQVSGGSKDIRSALFDPVSVTRLMALGVVEVQGGDQYQSSVTVLKDGRIVTAWTDTNSAIDDGNTDPDDDHVSIQVDQIVRKTTGNDTAETLVGDQLVDQMFGRFGGDTLKGEGGDDRLSGEGGGDTLDGGVGADTMDGGADSDTFIVDNAGDVVIEAVGGGINDRVLASVDYVLKAGVEVELLRTNAHAGTSAIDLTGNALKQTIQGNAGNNILDDGGGAGIDTLQGLGGNDIYRIGNSAAVIVEAAGGGSDRVIASVDYVLRAGVEVELMTTNSNGGTAAIDLTGNALKQTIIGNAGANILSDGGGSGVDTLQGLGGNDTYIVGNSGAVIVEAAGGGSDRVLASVDYVLKAGVEVETMSTSSNGGTAAIDLTGNSLAQTIRGNAGSNILDGKAGADTLQGLGGKDFFVFSSALGSGNVDTIADFSIADDTVRLENAIFAKLTATGALNAAFFRANSTGTAADGNDYILYDVTDGRLYYDADGNGAGTRIHFATLTGAPAITSADFAVI